LLGGQLSHVLWRWHANLLSQKRRKKKGKTIQADPLNIQA
jgi:hypothetical protein